MAKTLAEHINRGFTVVSEQRKLSYQVGGEVAFGKVAQGILGYEEELKHTASSQRKKELKNLIKEAKGGLEEFLGSSDSVESALAFYSASQDKTIQERFEQGFDNVLETAWRSGKI